MHIFVHMMNSWPAILSTQTKTRACTLIVSHKASSRRQRARTARVNPTLPRDRLRFPAPLPRPCRVNPTPVVEVTGSGLGKKG
jgi:hypothetical protein